jgi:hypothetical protein
MSKRRRNRRRSSNHQHKAAPEPSFSADELEFFRVGDSLHEAPTAIEHDHEPEAHRPSLWRRLFA